MSNKILPEDSIPVNDKYNLGERNQDDFGEISVDELDPVQNYTIVPNALLRDATISPECRWMISYFLSMKQGWHIKLKQLASHVKGFMGRDKCYKIFNEAIDAGYIRRDMIQRKHSSGKLLNGVKYTVSSYPRFKKCFRHPDCQDAGPQEADKTHAKELLSEEITSKSNTLLKVPTGTEEGEEIPPKKEKPKATAESFPPEVLETTQLMTDAMRIIKADYSAQNGKLLGILTEVDRMIRIDKRDPARIVDVFRWALCDSFWCDKMFKPNPAKYLREKFDQLEMKMRAEPQDAPVAQKPKEQEKPTLTKRLQGRYTYKINFGNYEFTSSNGYYVGKIPTNDPDALELWLRDKGL